MKDKIDNVNEKITRLFAESILKDEFNDSSQNNNLYNGAISGDSILNRLLSADSVIGSRLLIVGAGSSGLVVDKKFEVFNLEPCPQRNSVMTIPGWAENIPKDYGLFDVILCWGTLCFVRSLPETLISFNQSLVIGGKVIVDIVISTSMPLCQTTDKDSFLRYVQLFGFTLEEEVSFVNCEVHKRVGIRLNKYEDFDIRRLRIPQCIGKINNYLEKRDFYLK